MSQQLVQLQDATIRQHCKTLRVPTIGAQFSTLAEQAVREKKTHRGYLEALLSAESEERERNTISRRIKEAHLPRVKTLEEFDYNQSPMISAAKMQELAAGGYVDRAEPVLFIGECGTGKTHLLTGLCVAACRQQRLRIHWIRENWKRPACGQPVTSVSTSVAADVTCKKCQAVIRAKRSAPPAALTPTLLTISR
jgi:DNA replication protein DnaC